MKLLVENSHYLLVKPLMMHSSRALVLLALSTFILGASCYRFPRPQAILNRLLANHPHSKDIIHKRQTNSDECVDDELESADVDSVCLLTAQEEEQLDFDDELSQSSIDIIFREFCKPECGNAVLAAYIDCEAFEDEFIDLLVGLCGTNQNGEQCYQRFTSALDFVSDTEPSCFVSSTNSGECDCKSELSQAVEEQGCCLDVYHDFITEVLDSEGIRYVPRELYNDCDVNLPGGCNNSPISSSVPLVATVTTTTALIVAVVLAFN